MERLTKRMHNGLACLIDGEHPGDIAIEALQRLAAYEDTGLTPEEVREFLDEIENRFLLWVQRKYGISNDRFLDIVQAEQDGRLVVLPETDKDGDHVPNCFYNYDGGNLCMGMAKSINDDEPTEDCKRCLYCSVGCRQLEAEAAKDRSREEKQ